MLHLFLLCLSTIQSLAQDNTAYEIQKQLNASIATKKTHFVFPGGSVTFGKMALVIDGAHQMVIDGNQTTLIFEPGFGIFVVNGVGSVLQNLNIDYWPPPFVYGTIQALSSNSDASYNMTIELSIDSLDYETLENMYPPHDIWPPSVIINSETRIIRCTPCGWGTPPQYTKITGLTYHLSGVCGSNAKLGETVITPTRFGFTLVLVNSEQMVVQNIHIYHASYFAVIEARGFGNNLYNQISIASPYADRPLGSNADAFHSTGMQSAPTLENSFFRNIDDDFMNIHNTLQMVAAKTTSSLLVIDMQLNEGPRNSIYGTYTTLDLLLPSHTLQIFQLNQLAPKDLVWTGTISEIQALNSSNFQNLVESIYTIANKAAKGCILDACMDGLKPWADWQIYNITFETEIPETVDSGMWVNAYTFSASGAIIRNNDFYGTSASLARMKSPNSIIQYNKLGSSCRENFEVGPLQYWLEGPLGISNVTIQDNVILQAGTSPFRVYASDVTLSNNQIIP